MTRFNLCAFLFMALVLLVAPRAARAAESYDNCTGFITSVPAVISTQGTWCLKTDLSTAMTAGITIAINTNNVTIDCNDFKLGGLSAGSATQAYGIFALNRVNVTVRHCNIRGFFVGLSLAGGASDGGHAVEDNRFDGNTYLGLQVQGDGSVVQRNRVFNTGGSTANTDAFAISTLYSVDILDNTVSGATASGGNGYAHGISTGGNLSGRIIGNGVRGVLGSGTGQAWAISNTSSGRISLRKNDLVGTGAGSVGLFCSTVSGAAKNNIISGFASAIINCTDSGGNDIAP